MQVLKEGVRKKILEAAEAVFYEKDYRSAKLLEIAERADIPVALIYSYFKNKEELFNEIVAPVYNNFSEALSEEESGSGSPSQRLESVGEKYLHELLENHKRLILLVDKSSGTFHEKGREQLVARLEQHMNRMKENYQIKQPFDPILIHILANNYFEGLLEIARHYVDEKWAKNLLNQVNQCYYKGVESLFE